MLKNGDNNQRQETGLQGVSGYNQYQQRAQLYTYERAVDFNHEMALQQVRTARAVELEKIRLDIREQKGMLADGIKIDAAGNLVRRKEFLTVRPQKYAICNFFLPESPILYENAENSGERILYFKAGKDDGSLSEVYINLKATDVNYLRRQFRNSGLKLKVRANQVSDFLPLLLEALLERAKPTILPTQKGFYIEADGFVKYASRDALIWKEAVEHAR